MLSITLNASVLYILLQAVLATSVQLCMNDIITDSIRMGLQPVTNSYNSDAPPSFFNFFVVLKMRSTSTVVGGMEWQKIKKRHNSLKHGLLSKVLLQKETVLFSLSPV